jgi:hypothetical protein
MNTCVFDAVDDAGEGGVGTDPGGAYLQEAAPSDGSSKHAVAVELLDRHRLAGDGCFVERTGSADDLPIDGHLRTVLDEHRFAHHDSSSRHLDLLTVAHNDGDVGSHGDEFLQG